MSEDRSGGVGAGAGYVAPRALYVHVPICASKCRYCDFYSLPLSSLTGDFEDELVGATLDRASRLAERFGADAFDTVYIGGGTPTMLSEPALDRLLRGIADLASGPGGHGPVEWTIEANPDSLRPEALDIMARRGVTRLSVGVQSLDPNELELLGRRHGPEAALLALRGASERALAVSADLIAGIPWIEGSSQRPGGVDRLSQFARELIDAGACHLSVYDLSLEGGTPLSEMKGELTFPNEDDDWEARRRLEDSLADSGMRRYEVSNYSASGFECLHNLAYWRMDSYVGAGPGAVSTIARKDGASLRIEEPKSLKGYGRPGLCEAVETPISVRESAFESIMMAFRTCFGLDLAAFRERFGVRAEDLIGRTLAEWAPRLRAGKAWPAARIEADPNSRGSRIALDGAGLDILNRFLGACLDEIDSNPSF